MKVMFQNLIKKYPLVYSYLGMQFITFGLSNVFGLWLGSKAYLRQTQLQMIVTSDSVLTQRALYISDYLPLILWSACITNIAIAMMYIYLNRAFLKIHTTRIIFYVFLLLWYSLVFVSAKISSIFLIYSINITPSFAHPGFINSLYKLSGLLAIVPIALYIFSVSVIDVYSLLFAPFFDSKLFIPFMWLGGYRYVSSRISLNEVLWPATLMAIPPVVLGVLIIFKFCKNKN